MSNVVVCSMGTNGECLKPIDWSPIHKDSLSLGTEAAGDIIVFQFTVY